MDRNQLIEQIRRRFQVEGAGLNERQRRLWAAGEALSLGRGGIAVVSKALRISPNTIKRGIGEICDSAPEDGVGRSVRVRRSGGGRKPRPNVQDQ